jgi:hypothetical protein
MNNFKQVIHVNIDMRAEADPELMWVDGAGKRYLITEMETRHLFYVVRMIWNHVAPPQYRMPKYNRYEFEGGTESRLEYFREVICAAVPELATRPYLRPDWRAELQYMAELVRRGVVSFDKQEVSKYDT